MLADRRGSDLVEWIVCIVIIITVAGASVVALFNTISQKFLDLNAGIH